jgi:hypothetical protein
MATEPSLDAHASRRETLKAIARHLVTAGRVLSGFLFFVFGLNGLLSLLPYTPAVAPYGQVTFNVGLTAAVLIKATQILVGALLLLNRFVPVALTLMAVIAGRFLACDLCLTPTGTGIAILVGLVSGAAWSYWKLECAIDEAPSDEQKPETAHSA